MENISNFSVVVTVSLFALIYIIYHNVSTQLTTKNYILTTYMYIFFAFLLIIFINEEQLVPELKHGIKYIALFILMLILITALGMTDSKNQIMKHVLWVGFIVTIATFLNPVYNYAKRENILNRTLFTIASMFLVMTWFAYMKPLNYFNSWEPYLISGLVGIIVSRLVNIILSDLDYPSGFLVRDWIISIVTVILFNGFLLYDTQKILQEGTVLNKICIGRDNLECADYPVKSMNVIMDMVNLFVNTTNIYSIK